MIHITDKKDCCGCSACASICPKLCISMQEDNEGFLYPTVNESDCIDCGLCEKVCHELHPSDERTPLQAFAAINADENIRLQSSSGGIFYLLAQKTISEGGVVFGARFDEQWQVVIDYAETMEGVRPFMGSKYVQARMGTAYSDTKRFLQNGRTVLFSGTPCQIAGLLHFLRKPYDNLLTVDIVCHGVPSPKVWHSYLESVTPPGQTLTSINLRDKSRGWKRYSYMIEAGETTLVDEYAASTLYSQGFSLNLFLRPSCHRCPSKKLRAGSDITLADCWGSQFLENLQDDDKGLSTIICNTEKGQRILNSLNVTGTSIPYIFVKTHNPSLVRSVPEPYCRTLFWKLFPTLGIKAVSAVLKKLTNNPFYRIYNRLRTDYLK